MRLQVGGNACTCDAKYGRLSVNEREKYSWQPKNCDLIAWNATSFCQLLGTRIVYMQGDSTMGQTAHSLIAMIYTSNGGCANQIYFNRDHGAATVTAGMNRTNADIVVLNHGAHAKDDGDIHSWWRSFNDTMLSHKMARIVHRKPISFLWRTNHPGHLNCNATSKPSLYGVDNFPQYNRSIDYYRWSEFNRWDNISTKYASSVGAKIVDMSPLYSRPDAHPISDDCLHYCLPGPVDMFATLFLQMLYNKEI